MSATAQTTLWSAEGLPGVLLLRGVFVDTRFPPHFHEHAVVGTTERGAHDGLSGRHYYRQQGRGTAVLIPAGEVHTGETLPGVPWIWRAFYPSQEALAALRAELDGEAVAPALQEASYYDPELAARLLHAHQSFEQGELLRGGALFVQALSDLLHRQGTVRRRRSGADREPAAVRQVRDLIADRLADNLSLLDLSAAAGIGSFRLLRAFRKAYGVPPHRFQLALRISRAKELIAEGWTLSTAAVESGFCDQSHFSRHFKRIVGVTPQAYARALATAPSRLTGRT